MGKYWARDAVVGKYGKLWTAGQQIVIDQGNQNIRQQRGLWETLFPMSAPKQKPVEVDNV